MENKRSESRFETMDLSAININDSIFGDLNELGENKNIELVKGFGQLRSSAPVVGFSNLAPIKKPKIHEYRHKGLNSLYYL